MRHLAESKQPPGENAALEGTGYAAKDGSKQVRLESELCTNKNLQTLGKRMLKQNIEADFDTDEE